MFSFDEFCNFIEPIYLNANKTEGGEEIYPPNYQDLYSLYSKVLSSRSLAILEFGSGWSTLILAIALQENKNRDLEVASSIRHPNLYQLMTIDCEHRFMEIALQRLPQDLTIKIHAVETKAYMSVVNDQICTLYLNLPPFTADFIYLDGPDCGANQVLGEINGFSIRYGDESKTYGLPMSADLIRLEPHLWPATTIVTDGRGANARFLKNNFRRNWLYQYDEIVDQHIFFLDEPSWGKYSQLLIDLKRQSI